jgi:hypothetical protein
MHAKTAIPEQKIPETKEEREQAPKQTKQIHL